VAAYAAARLAREVGLHLRRAHLVAALGYGLPLVPHLFGQWALGTADRIILERYVTLADLGVYALAYQFGSILSVLALSLSNALSPTFSRVAVDAGEAPGLRRAATYYTLLLALAALGLALLSGELIALLLPAAYLPAGPLIPWVVLGCFILGESYLFSNGLAFTAGRTRSLAAATAVGAAANIGLNLLLVPRMGVLAAAVATAIGSAALALPTAWLAISGGVASFEHRRMIQITAAALMIYALGHSLMRLTPALNIVVGLAMIATTPALLYAMGFWRADELATIRRAWRREGQGI
jgi:O-antigen/teichoic acid export membrane protein